MFQADPYDFGPPESQGKDHMNSGRRQAGAKAYDFLPSFIAIHIVSYRIKPI